MLRIHSNAVPTAPSGAPKKAYALAGVNLDLGNSLKKEIGGIVAKTRRPEVLGSIGGFGGLFRASFPKMKDPVLVASIDGVGTKIKLAAMAGRHESVGEDLVHHCVNDIAVLGAEPLFFLDYIGTANLEPEMFRGVLTGLARACAACGCALIGGETAQMPGVYHGSDYDLIGTIVGIVDRREILDGSGIRPGDAIIGLPSNGLHTNGYSLARRLLFEEHEFALHSRPPGMDAPLGEALLRVHINYLPALRALRRRVRVLGLAHITGGGLMDNLPRILPKGTAAELDLDAWQRPPIFRLLASLSRLPEEELHQVFNMGIGMVAVVRAAEAKAALAAAPGAQVIGKIVKGGQNVRLFRSSAAGARRVKEDQRVAKLVQAKAAPASKKKASKLGRASGLSTRARRKSRR